MLPLILIVYVYDFSECLKSLIYLLGSETANHAHFMQSMPVLSCYLSSLEGDIRKVSKILTCGNVFEPVFILYKLVGQFTPNPGRHRDLRRQFGAIRVIFSHATKSFIHICNSVK